MTRASAKVHKGKVVELDYSGNAAEWQDWLPVVGEPPEVDAATEAVGEPTFTVETERVVVTYPVVPLPSAAAQAKPVEPLTGDEITRLRALLNSA